MKKKRPDTTNTVRVFGLILGVAGFTWLIYFDWKLAICVFVIEWSIKCMAINSKTK